MEELSIRIKVGDMEYSMKIKPEEEDCAVLFAWCSAGSCENYAHL